MVLFLFKAGKHSPLQRCPIMVRQCPICGERIFDRAKYCPACKKLAESGSLNNPSDISLIEDDKKR